MKYTKPALSFAEQAQRLMDRGLIVDDREELVHCLKCVNYYRLSAYWYPFINKTDSQTGDEKFLPNINFKTIWRTYTFDRKLRLFVMDALEHVEITILRTRMVEQFTVLHGPYGYRDIACFNPKFQQTDFNRLLDEIDEAMRRSKEDFVISFLTKYKQETCLPLWIAVETMTFGQLYTLFRYLNRTEQKNLADLFNLHPPVLESWLHTLNFIRNVCAHHSRLWNRELPIRPYLPDKRHSPEWYSPVSFKNERVFAVLTLLNYLFGFIHPQNDWKIRLIDLLAEYPEIPRRSMGFPERWLDSPLWIN